MGDEPGTAWPRRDVGRWHRGAPAHKPHPLPSSSPGIWGGGKGQQPVAGRAGTAACQVLSCPGRGSLPAECPPHPLLQLPGSRQATAAELLPQPWSSTSAAGALCPLTWKGEQGGTGAAVGDGHRALGSARCWHPSPKGGPWHPTLSVLSKPRLHTLTSPKVEPA